MTTPFTPAIYARLSTPWLTLTVPVAAALLDIGLNCADLAWWQVSLGVLAALVLLLRRLLPITVLLLTLPAAFVTPVWMASMAAVYTVASRQFRMRTIVACSVAFSVAEYFHYPLVASEEFRLTLENANFALTAVMVSAGSAALGLLSRTRRELAARLDQLTKGQQRESRLQAERVLASERARLAREMHDVVSHQVSLISIQAGALQVSTTDPAARQTASTIRELSVRTLDELRQMVGVLRRASVRRDEPLAPQPRLADLPGLIEDSGLPVTTELAPEARSWPEAVERAAYRTVQEALTNIRKHAPGAEVRVRLTSHGPRLLVEIHNGPPPLRRTTGAALPGGGHGLVGLRERAELLGGALTAGPSPNGGFTVLADLPAD